MTRLDERSYLQVLEVIHNVREVTDPDQFGAVTLSEIARLVDSEVLSFNEVDPGAGRFDFVVEPPTFQIPPSSSATLTRLAGEHPLIQHLARTGDGSARRISDVWTVQQWHDSAVFQQFYGPLGIEYQMSIALPAPLPIVVGIALNRSSADFDERDRTVLNLLRPHLAQSWRLAREHRRVRALLHAASGALASAEVGVIILSDPPYELTSGALVNLYRFFGRPGEADPLPPRVSRWLLAQRSAGNRLARPLSVNSADRRVVLRFLPAADGHPPAILLHSDIGATTAPGLSASGLSGREVEVMQALVTGATNVEIGAQLHIAASTVKKHLDRIYAKLGVSGRVAATAVMLDMLGHHTS